jgi:hypothetical protein
MKYIKKLIFNKKIKFLKTQINLYIFPNGLHP